MPATRRPDYDADGYPAPESPRRGHAFDPFCTHRWLAGVCMYCGGIRHPDYYDEDAA